MINKKVYFVTGRTSTIDINFLPANVEGLEKIIVLNHPSLTLKTAVLRNIIDYYQPNHSLEIILSSVDDSYVEGVICRKELLAIITDRLVTPEILTTQVINLADFFETYVVSEDQLQAKKYRDRAAGYFSQGLAVHDDLEKIYIEEMDFTKADKMFDDFIQILLQNELKREQPPCVYHRFFGTTTAKGPVNVVPHLIKNLSRRVYIKGRAGTGKSVFMKKVATACQNIGLDTELYHCSFDPDSIDMVLVPELSFCIFDSTDPHAFSPERTSDMTIDLYEGSVTPGTDEKFAAEIKEVTRSYKSFLQQGINSLKQAHEYQIKSEEGYKIITEKNVKEVTNTILKHIM